MSTLQAAPDLPAPAPELHRRIAQARGYRLLSQDGLLAAMAELDAEGTPTRRTYSKWENGHMSPTVNDLVLIARATGFPVAWFVLGLEAPTPPDGGSGLGKDVSERELLEPQVTGILLDFPAPRAA